MSFGRLAGPAGRNFSFPFVFQELPEDAGYDDRRDRAVVVPGGVPSRLEACSGEPQPSFRLETLPPSAHRVREQRPQPRVARQ
jgi:hypothetical protein